MRVTTHLIVPLDIRNAILFLLYLAASNTIRSQNITLEKSRTAALYDGVFL
ncbi:hypothetical protein AAVH_11913, partial [Aphelenchoides avenae]